MELSKLPTDNFYVFLSISGLALIIYIISVYIKKTKELIESIDREDKKRISLNHKVDFQNNELTYILGDLRLKELSFTLKYKLNYHELIDMEIPLVSNDTFLKLENREAFLSDFKEINQIKILISKEQSIRAESFEILSRNVNSINFKKSEQTIVTWIALLTIIIGIIISVAGFANWYFRYQWYQDKIIEATYKKVTNQHLP